jgi:TPR repeat protein
MEFLQAAKNGGADAQYGMGLIYAEGRGVEQDEAQSFFWLTLAHEQGDEHADVLRRVVAASMTPEHFSRAEFLLEEHASRQYKSTNCARRRRKGKSAREDLH